MRDLFLVTLISFVLGTDFSLQHKEANILWGELFPFPNKFLKHPVLGWDRRRPEGVLSDGCKYDFSNYQNLCLPNANVSCDSAHTKWVMKIDHDTEYMCYPSDCSANDLQYIYSTEMEFLSSSAKYCTLDCPAIKFDISGTSEDGQVMSLSGMYNYADLSYDCTGAAALTEISKCEETGACPSKISGLTTCTIVFQLKTTSVKIDGGLKQNGKICLPNECTDDANLKKMEDFLYAYLANLLVLKYNLRFSAREIRSFVLVNYSCPGPPKYTKYILVFGILSAVLFVLCFGAICIIRVRRGGVGMTPIVAVEFHNQGSPSQYDQVDTGIGEADPPRAVPSDYARPIQTNNGMQRGEADH